MKRLFACTLMLFAAAPSLAADANGYTAKYECRAGGPNCNVDVAALGNRTCDQTIAASTSWSSINWSNNTICLEAGDHTGKGMLTIPSSANGGAGNYKVLRYSGSNNDDPWKQSGTNQAKVLGLKVNANYWIIHRLTFPGVSGTDPSPRIESGAGKTNQIFNRLLVEGDGSGSNYYGYSQDGGYSGYDNLTVQNSVFRNLGPYGPIWEAIAIDVGTGSNIHVVNNEVYDWVSHPIQIGHNGIPTMTGVVIENNDTYVTSALYTSGNTKAKAESAISVKASGTSGSPLQIIHNRVWGTRLTDLSYCCNGEDGNAFTHYDSNEYVLFQNNIIFDAQIGINNVADKNSFIGNIFFAIKQYNAGINSLVWNDWHSHDGAAAYEFYFNTIVDAPQYAFPSLDDANVDTRCNVVLSSGSKYSSSPPGTSVADYNVFYDSPSFTFNGTNTNIERQVASRSNSTFYQVDQIIRTGPISSCVNGNESACFFYKVTQAGTSAGAAPAYCNALGCTQIDGGLSTRAIRGPYTFYRKLRTSPETYTIPYARTHTSAPETGACPSGYATRLGIGINNVN